MSEVATIADLLASPSDFDRREVAVSGFFVAERENCALYGSPDDVRVGAASIWLRHPANVLGKEGTRRMNRAWVTVVGTFHNRRRAGAGLFGVWTAELSGKRSILASCDRA